MTEVARMPIHLTIQRSDELFYQAYVDGPLRPIIVESDSDADVFLQVLMQIAEQGKEMAGQNQ